MKKSIKVCIVIGIIIIFIGVLFAIYWRHNMHREDEYLDGIKKSGAVEKQVTFPSGNLINYGEVNNGKPAERFEEKMKEVMEFASVIPEE